MATQTSSSIPAATAINSAAAAIDSPVTAASSAAASPAATAPDAAKSLPTNPSLHGKRIILMGGSSGIGLATAKYAAAEGAKLIIVSGNQQRIDSALKELPADAEGHPVDLSKEENIKAFFETIGAFDHLVYTAGENISLSLIKDTEIDQARQYFTLRYWGAFTAVKYGAPHIRKGGSITLTSGTASPRPAAGWSLGASICSAIEGFTRAMAVELAPIRVNAIAPGVVKTNLWNSLSATDREGLYTSIGNQLLVKRVGEAEEIAQAYIYMMKQTYGSGQTLLVDGGAVLV